MSAPVAGSAISADDLELLARLRRGDEAAFTQLVERLHGPMLRLAMVHVGNRAVAEEVVQDAWVGVLAQLGRFEGRSSLRTWVLRIVANRARTRAVRRALERYLDETEVGR
ncbi:MAG TPA: RNA polymerase sigma factor [Actinomycetes bacterium]|nr:RNA polymerase sigma factor [Actinomycetes bacterium]